MNLVFYVHLYMFFENNFSVADNFSVPIYSKIPNRNFHVSFILEYQVHNNEAKSCSQWPSMIFNTLH